MNKWTPDFPLSSLELFQQKEVQALAEANLHVLEDLLNWFPRRYEDRRAFDAFPVQVGGEAVCVRGV